MEIESLKVCTKLYSLLDETVIKTSDLRSVKILRKFSNERIRGKTAWNLRKRLESGDKIKNAINLCQSNLRLKMAMFRASNYIYLVILFYFSKNCQKIERTKHFYVDNFLHVDCIDKFNFKLVEYN